MNLKTKQMKGFLNFRFGMGFVTKKLFKKQYKKIQKKKRKSFEDE